DEQILRAWMLKDKVGMWKSDWKEVERRDASYFINYDMHIRVWVPYYDQLIAQAAGIIQREIARLMRLNHHSLELLEVGYGTGALTVPLVSWLETLNRPFESLRNNSL